MTKGYKISDHISRLFIRVIWELIFDDNGNDVERDTYDDDGNDEKEEEYDDEGDDGATVGQMG